MTKKRESIRGSLLKDALKEHCSGDILIDLGVIGKEYSRKMPDSCQKCDSDKFFGLEILGACNGTIFWVCEKCDTKVMKYTQKTTLKYLNQANKLYSCSKDWDDFPYQESN